jgi:hypothetical protein
MERMSNKHGPRLDEEMGREVRGIVQGVAGARAEEWKHPEPAGEDQPDATVVPNGVSRPGPPGGVDPVELERFSRFGRYIGLSALPGDRDALRRSAETLLAPEDVLAELDRLPDGAVYHTTAEVWGALGHEL